jgi:hypothetical protein
MKMNLFCPSITTALERRMVCCALMICVHFMRYTGRERERRVEEKDNIVDEKKITPYRYKQQRKISINIKYIETK